MWSFCCPLCARSKVGSSDRHIKLLMLGLDNSGKTCTAKCLVGNHKDVSNTAPTIGFSKVETKYKGFQVIQEMVRKVADCNCFYWT